MAESVPSLPSSAVAAVDDSGKLSPAWFRQFQDMTYADIPVYGIVLMDSVKALSLPKSWEVVDIGTAPPTGYTYVKRVV